MWLDVGCCGEGEDAGSVGVSFFGLVGVDGCLGLGYVYPIMTMDSVGMACYPSECV